MRRFFIICIVCALLGLISGVANARWVDVGGSASAMAPVQSGSAEHQVVTWTLPGFAWDEIQVAGVLMSHIDLPGQPRLQEAGWPEVPVVPLRLDLPARGACRLEILEHRMRVVPLPPVAPSVGHVPHVPGQEALAVPGPFYTSDTIWPAAPVVLGRAFLAGDVRGVNLRLQPLRWDAERGVLLVTEYLRIAVVTDPAPGENEFADAVAKTAVTTAPRMLIVVPDALRPALTEFRDWKTRCGIDVEKISPAALGGTAAGIAAGIAARHAEPAGLVWVLLVGDRAEVPTLAGTYEGADSDQRYAMVAGDDLHPDLMVSRLPARTQAELLTQIARIMAYERDATAGVGLFDRASGVASAEGSPADHVYADALRDVLLTSGFTSVDQIYQVDGAGTDDVHDAVLDGASLINYLGHGTGTAWQSVPFTTDDVRTLGNTASWPWIIDASCLNGDFARDECLAEAWLRAGTTAAPAGAVGVLAATSLVPWTPPIHLQDGIVEALTTGGVRSLGELTVAGLARVLDIYDGLPVAAQMVEQYVLFGDASLLVRTRAPSDFHVTVDRAVGAYDATWWVKVDGPAGSVVALTAGGSLLGRGVVDSDGQTDVALLGSIVGYDELELTVTGPDMVPWLGTVDVVHGLSATRDVQPAGLRSLGNHPNPFNPTTVIACELAESAPVHLTVHDLAGRRVRILAAGTVLDAGHREFVWNGRDDAGRPVGSGVYLYRLAVPGETVTGRMTLVK